MNGNPIYPGYYGKTHKEIYERLLRGESGLPDDLAAEMRAQTHTDSTQPLFDRVLDVIFGTRRSIERQIEEYRRNAQNNPHNPSNPGSTETNPTTIDTHVDSDSKVRNYMSFFSGFYHKVVDYFSKRD